MKYFLAQAIMHTPLPEDFRETYLPLHEKHIAAGIEAGHLLLAGPKFTAGGGGLFIARFPSREDLDAFTARDPYAVYGLAEFDVCEFGLFDRAPEVRDW